MKVGGEEGGERAMEMQRAESRPRLSMPAETARQHGMWVNTAPLAECGTCACVIVHIYDLDPR